MDSPSPSPSIPPESGGGASAGPATTEGTLLGGRVIYRQPDRGFRSGIEPVLLAASVPARAGQLVLEGGSGAGAGLLCLAARVPSVRGLGIEADAGMVALARDNAACNGFGLLAFEHGDVRTPTMAPGSGGEPVHHAFANPPYHPEGSPPSPLAAREAAKRSEGDVFHAWSLGLARRLIHGGTLTLVGPVAAIAAMLAGIAAAGCGSAALLPLWPRPGVAAKLVIVQARRGGRGGLRLLPGLTLHEPAGGFTAWCEAVLRGGEALEL